MKRILQLSILMYLLNLTTGCVSPDDPGTGSASSSGAPSAPTASEDAPLKLQISTTYDTTTTNYDHKFIETGTTSCAATVGTPVVTCTVAIPEGRLYHSAVNFSYSWRNDKCKLMVFRPYYYISDTASAAFAPPWVTSSVDCTKAPLAASCYGGAAPYIVPGFPAYVGLIYMTDPTTSTPQSKTLTLKSADSIHYGSNRLSANELPVGKQGVNYTSVQLGTPGDHYNANSFQTYRWTCQDDWYDTVAYQINLVITDVDSDNGGTINDFTTWKEL